MTIKFKLVGASSALVSFATAATDEVTDSEYVGGVFYRFAVLFDAVAYGWTVALAFAGIVLFIGGSLLWATGHKNNIPKQTAIVMIVIAITIASPRACTSMQAKQVLGTSEVQAYDAIDSAIDNGYIESNTE